MNWFKQIFTAASGQMSSKRVCGVLGWLVCLGAFIYCTYQMIQAPTMVDILLLSCMGLLGVDSVTSIWKK